MLHALGILILAGWLGSVLSKADAEHQDLLNRCAQSGDPR
jgi:hypothetical protein